MSQERVHPRKLVVEPTTRCNLKCNMCVKQSAGCTIEEADLEYNTFASLLPVLPKLEAMVLTGVGEPLLHRGLDRFISTAQDQMPPGSTIGFQTNGKGLTPQKAVSLVRSGLNRICLSVDAVNPEQFHAVRSGGAFSDILKALDALAHAREMHANAALQIGIEFVLMKQNMQQLPQVVAWAAKQGLDFMLVSHMTAYEAAMEDQAVWLKNTKEAAALFGQYQAKARQWNLDLRDYTAGMVKYHQSEKEKKLCGLIRQLKQEAASLGLYVNVANLQAETEAQAIELFGIFKAARKKADQGSLDLLLPGYRPEKQRYCPFIEEDVMFVAVDGTVSPCYFLWHHYATARAGDTKQVSRVSFGNVNRTDPTRIWNDPAYKSFRQNVRRYDYPDCQAWCEKRCDYVLEPFFQDCCINTIPCCDCHWGLGLLHCLV